MTKRTKRILHVADRACLLAFALFAILVTASLLFRSGEPPIARHVFANGTTYLLVRTKVMAWFSRQTASPKSAGPLVVNVETPNLIDVFDNGQRLPGMKLVPPEHHWMPAIESNVMGWHRGGNVLSGMGMFGPSSIFRVSFQTITLPMPFLLLMTVLTAIPMVWSLRRRHGHGESKTVGQPAAA